MKKFLLLITVFFCCSISSYSQPGQLNASFGNKGWVKEDFIKTNLYSEQALQVLPQENGSYIIVITANNALGRFLSDGTLDTSFAKAGYLFIAGIEITKVVQQSDGKIVIAGSNANAYSILQRYNLDGSLDNSFNGNGMQATDFEIKSVAIQGNGKIVAGGSFSSDFAIARYNTDGSPDLSFDEDGKLIQDFFGYDDEINSVAVQNDGKIIVAGTIFIPLICPRCSPEDGQTQAVLVRYNPDGSIDNRFGEYEQINNEGFLSTQPDGKTLLASRVFNGSNFDIALSRYNSDGSVDLSFNKDGGNFIDFGNDDFPSSVAFQDDGKIVVTAWTDREFSNSIDFAIARYNYNGSVDSSFDEDGKLTTDLGFNDFANSVAIQSDGKILVAGGTTGINNWDFALTRYNTNGTLDNTFSNDGKTIEYVPAGVGTLYSIATQTDGKIVVAGDVRDSLGRFNFFISRYNPDGSADKTFSDDGKQITDFGYNSATLSSLVIQSDGKIVAVGSVFGDLNTFGIARYNTDGDLDSTFSGDGKEVTKFGGTYASYAALCVVLADDGKIVVGGGAIDSLSNTDFAIVRYNSDGSLDKTFSDDGVQTTDFNSDYDVAFSLAIQNDKKIVVGGRVLNGSNLDFAIARYNTDGSLDNTFSSDGKNTTDFASDNDYGNPIAIQNDGKIVLAGSTLNNSQNEDIGIIRYNTDGSLDATFGKDGKVTTDFGLTETAFAVNLQTDGKLVIVGGTFQTNFIGDIAIARYNSDGSPDSSFDDDGKVITDFGGNERGSAAAIFMDKLYVAGENIIASYNLTDEIGKVPTVTLTSPADDTTYIALADIPLTAEARNFTGTVKKIQFFSGTTLLATQNFYPYTYTWHKVPAGEYYFTAKATDDKGVVTTSEVVYVTVVPNKPPIVSITSPSNNSIYAMPATIALTADAKDIDGSIRKVQFFSGTTLLATQNFYPYTYTWHNVHAGKYAFTAQATDDKGVVTTSAVVHVSVRGKGFPFVTTQKSSTNNEKSAKLFSEGSLSLKVGPNPVKNILNLYTTGLENKRLTISVVTVSGIVIKTIQKTSGQTMQMDVSSLKSGVYFLKVLSGDKVLYTQFVKL